MVDPNQEISPKALALVADPDADSRGLCREVLSAEGWAIEEAENGPDALAKALATRPALVISELDLPFFDGFAFCELLRRDPATSHVPILIVTADTSPAHLTRARHAGADAVLVKPCLPAGLLEEAERLRAASETLKGRAALIRARATQQRAKSAVLQARSARSQMRIHALRRYWTTTPPVPPPVQWCPVCDRALAYERSHVGGVNAQEPQQWDYYTCAVCGSFQYRHAVRKLRRLDQG